MSINTLSCCQKEDVQYPVESTMICIVIMLFLHFNLHFTLTFYFLWQSYLAFKEIWLLWFDCHTRVVKNKCEEFPLPRPGIQEVLKKTFLSEVNGDVVCATQLEIHMKWCHTCHVLIKTSCKNGLQTVSCLFHWGMGHLWGYKMASFWQNTLTKLKRQSLFGISWRRKLAHVSSDDFPSGLHFGK